METATRPSNTIVNKKSYDSVLTNQPVMSIDTVRSINEPNFVDVICNKLTDIFLSGSTPFARAELAHQAKLQCIEGHIEISDNASLSSGEMRPLNNDETALFLYFFSSLYKAMELFSTGQESSYSFSIIEENQSLRYDFSLTVTDSSGPNCKTVILKNTGYFQCNRNLKSGDKEMILISFQIIGDKNNIRINDRNGKSGQTEEIWNNINQPTMIAELRRQCAVVCPNVTSDVDLKLRVIELIEDCSDNNCGPLLSKLAPIIVSGINTLVQQMREGSMDNNRVIVTFIDSKQFQHPFEISATDDFDVTLKPVNSRKFNPIVLLPNDKFEELLTKSPLKSTSDKFVKGAQTTANNTNVTSSSNPPKI